jgi:hypothetical protein
MTNSQRSAKTCLFGDAKINSERKIDRQVNRDIQNDLKYQSIK